MKHLVQSPYMAEGQSVLYAFLNMHNDDALPSGQDVYQSYGFAHLGLKILQKKAITFESLCISQRKCVCYVFIIKPII